jgi:hypothetical protein
MYVVLIPVCTAILVILEQTVFIQVCSYRVEQRVSKASPLLAIYMDIPHERG